MFPTAVIADTVSNDDLLAYYKEKMDEAYYNMEVYESLVADDTAIRDGKLKVFNTAKNNLETAKQNMEDAEWTLDLKSKEYHEAKVYEAWQSDLAYMKSINDDWYIVNKKNFPDLDITGHTWYTVDGMINDLNAYSNKSPYNAILVKYNKISSDALEKSVIRALGYNNTMYSLDQIDECNNIRLYQAGDYYQGVLGESTPSGIQALKVSPYLMTITAMSSALNSSGVYHGHIYGAVAGGIANTQPGTAGCGQNLIWATFSGNGSVGNPWPGWWTQENKDKKSAHNKNIVDKDWTVTGFGALNTNPLTNQTAMTQDFANVNTNNWKVYTVVEYRNGLVDYCGNEYRTYQSRVNDRQNAITAYNDAQSAYSNAENQLTENSKKLKKYKSDYQTYKAWYEEALANQESQQTYYTVKWIDGVTKEIVSETSVKHGAAAYVPIPPVHNGYTFKSYSMPASVYNCVTANLTITINYTKNSDNPAGDDTGGTVTQKVTLKFINGVTGQPCQEVNKKIGDTFPTIYPPENAGYKFTGWSPALPTTVKGAGTYTAQYTKVQASTANGASEAEVDKAITSSSSEEGPAGSVFRFIALRSTSQGKANIKLAWNKPAGAAKFVIYGNVCGKKNKMKKLATSSGKSYNIKKISKTLKKGTYHKFMVVALDKNNKVISVSKVIHVTTKGGTVKNPTKISYKKPMTLKQGQTHKLKAKQVGKNVKKHRGLAYETSNAKVATVSGKGVITAKGKGTCYVYVYAQNGIYKAVKVTVK